MERVTKKKQIEEQLLQYLADKPEGARYSDIMNYISGNLKDISKNTIIGLFRNIIKSSEKIEKIGRGRYRLKSYSEKPQKKPRSAKSQRTEIMEKIKEYLEEKREGARLSDIENFLKNQFPDYSPNTFKNILQHLKHSTQEITSLKKGVYILKKYTTTEEPRSSVPKFKEEDFYGKFAKYLIEELNECTNAIPLGGKKSPDKWGTPDVLGVYKFPVTYPIKSSPEFISAEIKTNNKELITAFGQACAYKIFSHKVYLVVPMQAEMDVIGRLEALCMRFGIGLILFNKYDCEHPDFQIRTRALKSEPDYHYVNMNIQRFREDVNKLLG